MSLTLDLLRHGETGTAPGFRGWQDDPLSSTGWQQLHDAVAAGGPWTGIVSSPLQRCAAFARQLAQQHGLPLTLEPNLRELYFGEWEGLTTAQVMQDYAPELGHFWADPYGFTPPNGEPLNDFAARIFRALQQLLRTQPKAHLLVITHAGVMRLLLAQARGLPRQALLNVEVKHAACYRLQVACSSAGAWQLTESPCKPC